MKNDSSQNLYAWFDVSSKLKIFNHFYYLFIFELDNLDDERSWIRKYIEFDRTNRTLTFYSNEVCNFLILMMFG
jgi:hypothetical protein